MVLCIINFANLNSSKLFFKTIGIIFIGKGNLKISPYKSQYEIFVIKKTKMPFNAFNFIFFLLLGNFVYLVSLSFYETFVQFYIEWCFLKKCILTTRYLLVVCVEKPFAAHGTHHYFPLFLLTRMLLVAFFVFVVCFCFLFF